MSDFAWDDGSIMDQIDETIKTLGWEPTDDIACLLYTSPSPRDVEESRMPSSA